MLYLISDIHGNLKDFRELLGKIEFSGSRAVCSAVTV